MYLSDQCVTECPVTQSAGGTQFAHLLYLQQLLCPWLQVQALLHQLPAHTPLAQLQGSTCECIALAAWLYPCLCVRSWQGKSVLATIPRNHLCCLSWHPAPSYTLSASPHTPALMLLVSSCKASWLSRNALRQLPAAATGHHRYTVHID
jgi:hypothetical protein